MRLFLKVINLVQIIKCTLLFFVIIISGSACDKSETAPPVITIQGSNPDVVILGSDTTYADPGAVANDNSGSNLTVSVSGTVNMFSAGDYSIKYSATDAAGIIGEATRTVIVDGGQYLSGNYTVEDFTGTVSNGTYPETIDAPTICPNKIYFSKFAFHVNGTVYGTISGTIITIPTQTITCGCPEAERTFSGTGTFTTANPATFTIHYSEISNGHTVQGHGVYSLI